MAHYILTRTLIDIADVMINLDAPYPMTREYLGKFSGAYTALYYTEAITNDEWDFYTEINNLIFAEVMSHYFPH